MPRIELNINGDAASAIEAIQRITGKKEPVDVIMSALRIYEWILAQQTRGATIVAELPEELRKTLNADDLELADYVKDRTTAQQYFKDRDIA